MGNRAVITTKQKEIGVYLHWNGGRDSVSAFLKYCELQGYRSPDTDCYGWAYLCQVVGNFFGDGMSVGIDRLDRLDCDNGDNGVYIIEGWEIVDRMLHEGLEQDQYDMTEMLLSIDSCMPERQKLGREFIMADEMDAGELAVGDKVIIRERSTCFQKGGTTVYEVIGIGTDMTVNGTDVKGLPLIMRYGSDIESARWNINNYLRGMVHRKPKGVAVAS